MTEPEDEETPRPPKWRCEECGHTVIKPHPTDRDAYYKRLETRGAHKCPKCKSEAFVPVGF